MDPPQWVAPSPPLPADEDVGQTSRDQLGAQSQSSTSQDQRELQQLGGHSLQLEFQDSNLSPALSLLPINSGVEHNFTECSLFQQSDTEFAPLRAYPDISMASERFHFPPQDCTTRASEDGSLSQHPLTQATVLSEEGSSSCCSLSQHSLSPGDQGKRGKIVHPPMIPTADDRQGALLRDEIGSREKELETLIKPPDKPVGEDAEDETFFLSKDIPAQCLLELLQKDVGMPSSSSSAVSSASETSVNSTVSFTQETKSTEVCNPVTDQRMVRREGPPGEASHPQQQTQHPDRVSNPDQSPELLSEVPNITMGSRRTQPDESSEVLHRELLFEAERSSSHETQSKNDKQKSLTPHGQSLALYLKEMSQSKPNVIRTDLGGAPWTGPFSAGVERVQREQDLWSSGNRTGIDGSYLGFLPQSQSTPGVFKAPPTSSVKAKLGQLSAIDSNKESLYQSSTEISTQPAVPIADTHHSDAAGQCQAKVRSLPTLSYMEKVDAWRANQSSGKTSLFDSLALQGFSGISPKKKAYDAVSDTLNRIFSQRARSSQQPLVSVAADHSVTQSSSTVPSGSSSPRRGEAVGSAPSDKDNTVSAAPPSASPFARSQSHSSLSTVVMSVLKDQQTGRPSEKERSQDDAHHHSSATVEPSPLMSLGHFSDVSLDRDLTLSNSQDSNSGIKLGTSIEASSIVSLELDNYAPYWTSKLSTPPPPPRPREFNIDERIPLYLHNLGIDQSPSTILTPFAPRGPIREPEFSPTDLCTIKGSVGTSTKSTQPSEGGSPHKGQCSRSSILSVDSSVSIPFSLDSLSQAVSLPERASKTPPPSDTEAIQSERRLTVCSQPDEHSLSSVLQSSQQRQNRRLTSSHNINQLGDKFDSDVSLAIQERCGERNSESLLQTSHSVDQSAEDSFVSSKALLEIRKLLSHTENVISTGPSAASSASPTAPHLLSDEDIFLSRRKKASRLQDSSFCSSSSAGDSRTRSSLLWTRSSSDSMLTSEKQRQSSVGRESMTSTWQPDYPSTQALITAPATAAYKTQQDSAVSSGAAMALVLSKSDRRAEPEGCSAAPPDKVPAQPPVNKPLPAVNTQQLASSAADAAGVLEEEEKRTVGGPIQSNSSSPILDDSDQGVMSDGSSQSSLAVRVAKLLQSESPATMVSSTPSVTDHEESKAREWIKLKISGQQCEPLELDKEDRRRIEEIKRELLLKNPIKSQGSTDTESSAASSVRVQREHDPPQHAETLATLTGATNQPTQLLQGLSTNPPDSSTQLKNVHCPDLEAQVYEIAAREGVTLPTKNPRALTSITITTCRRSTSPSPSSSPAPPLSPASEPLHLTELSSGALKPTTANRRLPVNLDEEDKVASAQTTTTEPPSVFEPVGSRHARNQNMTSQSAPGNQTRQDAVGGQFEEPPPPPRGLGREEVTIERDSTQSVRQDDKLSVQSRSVSGVNQATGSSSVESPTRTGHISHVHLTLSPKATDHTFTTAVHSSHANAASGLRKDFIPLRHSSSAASSPDEGVGLSSPPEWHDTREPVRQRAPERSDTSTHFESVLPQRGMTATSAQSFTPRHGSEISPPVPVLLPYKPHGSEELFYVPQTEADVSSPESSDTTMESSHTGSDDAVPPHFSSEVLGHRDPGLDRGVTIRHTEGIYSKKLKTATFKMQEPGHTDASVAAKSSTSVSHAPIPSSHVSVAFTRVPLSCNQEAFKRDQGTSPVQFLHYNQPEPSRERLQPVHVEMDYNKGSTHLVQTSVPQTRGERDQQWRDPDPLQPTSQQSSNTLDQLWQRFCDRWTMEESHSNIDREASLLERLERLSHLIHSTRAANVSKIQEEDDYHPEQKLGMRREDVTLRRKERKDDFGAVKRSVRGVVREMQWTVRGGRKVEPPIQLRFQVENTPQPAEDDSRTSSSFSHSSSQSRHLSPAERDESETLTTRSDSMSTVDTARLIRAFGAHKVKCLKSSSSLSKLYSNINKQKEGREQRRGNRDPPHITTPSETTVTDESVAADSASSSSTYTLPSHRGPSRTLAAKKAVKLVNKGIQAGDLEIVRNGTRRHTRDVGTTFPSPSEATAFEQLSSSSSAARGRGGQRSPSKSQGVQKQRKSRSSPSTFYPEGVSWFISADNLRSEARKENQPEESSSAWRPSTAWFEPYSRINLWRAPLRQRQVHEDRNEQSSWIHQAQPDPDPVTKTMSSGLIRVSLQEALEIRRPEFISRSRQRVKRLALQAEERKLLGVFSRDRDELFNQPGGPAMLRKPAGTGLLRRAVPRKEMIQRSKQIYETLPEVQSRREEERRKAEYRSYRLNAQLYNKRVTNRVLGRRPAWQ